MLAGYEVESQIGTYAVTINPLVNWIWFGFGVLALGTGIALLPERAFAFAGGKVPEGAATTVLLLVALLLPAHGVRAQTRDSRAASCAKQLEGDLMCTCGGCKAPMNNCPMGPSCHGLKEQRAKIERISTQGMDREQILRGLRERSRRPGHARDAARRRLQPAGVGVAVLRSAAPAPRCWSARGVPLVAQARRRSRPTPSAHAKQEDAGCQARLDDELRDLD